MERKRLGKLFGLTLLLVLATLAPGQVTGAEPPDDVAAADESSTAEVTGDQEVQEQAECSLDSLLLDVPEPVPMVPACSDDRPVCNDDSDCHSYCFKETGGCRLCGACGSDSCCLCL